MKTNIIKFVENEKEFLTVGDLFDLIDFEKLDEEGQELYLTHKAECGDSQMTLAKSQEKNPVDVHGEKFVAVHFVCDYSSKLMMMIDRKSKLILLYPFSMFIYGGIPNDGLYKRVKEYALKSDLDGYSIHTVEEATNSFKEMERQLNEGLVEKHLEDILSYKNEEFEEESLLNEIKFNYVMNKENLKKEDILFTCPGRGNRSLMSFYEGVYIQLYSFLLAYYSTPSLLKEKLEKDFMEFISKEGYFLSCNANEIYKALKLKEVYELHKESIENDESLNEYKKIIDCVSKCLSEDYGKTINVNGTYIDNEVCCYHGLVDKIYLGTSKNKFYLKDIEVIEYSDKELYKKPLSLKEKVYLNGKYFDHNLTIGEYIEYLKTLDQNATMFNERD